MGRKAKSEQLKESTDNFLDAIVEKFGDNVLSNIRGDKVEAMTTGSLSLDACIGIGGFPKGRFTLIYGPEGCLSGDTFIQYTVLDKDGERVNHKVGTLKNLYKRYKQNVHDFTVSSMMPDGRIFHNKVDDVVYSGVKETFLVTTESGNSIICTKDHKFLTDTWGYKPLEELKEGSVVFIHNNTRSIKEDSESRQHRPALYVKYHPSRKTRIVNGSVYYRVPEYHMVYEAFANGVGVDKLREIYNTESEEYINENIWTIPHGYVIHHIDEDPTNNNISNLKLMTKIEHDTYHANMNIRNLSYIVVEDKIRSIELYGDIDTYDIKCPYPQHNFIANGIVVHNSCKTTTALSTSIKEIENGGKVLYMDAENMLSFATIEQMLGKSVDRSKFILIQPETAEQAFMIIEKAITSKEFTLIVIDTIAALEPQEEKDKEFDENTMMATPRLMSKFFRRNAADVKNANVAVLLLNQIRDDTKSYMGGYKSTGGHALLHYSSVIIAFTKGVEIKQGEDKIGVNARFVVKKNKMGAPFRSFEIPIIFGRGLDFYTDAVSFCETLGVIQKNGSHYKFEGVAIGQGRNAAAEYLRNNTDTLDKITKKLYNVMNKQPQIIEEEGELDAEVT